MNDQNRKALSPKLVSFLIVFAALFFFLALLWQHRCRISTGIVNKEEPHSLSGSIFTPTLIQSQYVDLCTGMGEKA